jgi:hypothetical protein
MTEKESRNRILMPLSVKSSELVCIFMEASKIFPRRQPETLKINSACAESTDLIFQIFKGTWQRGGISGVFA